MKDVFQYFNLPVQVQIDIPITKISLKNNENCTLSDRKLLDGSDVQSIRLKALIKQETANIPSYYTENEMYVEVYFIEVIIQTLVYKKIYKSIIHLLNKLIPHHCIIITKNEEFSEINIGLASKIISKNSDSLRVIQRENYSNNLSFENELFNEAIRYHNANKYDLKAFYQYYTQVLQNYNLLDVTQDFKLRTYEITERMLKVQDRIDQYETQINKSVKELKSTTQMSEKVRINSDIHGLKQKVQELKNTLSNYGED